MRHLKTYILLIVFNSAILIGCLDDPIKYNTGTIEGRVYDQYGMDDPFVKVSIGDYPIVATNIYGKFSLENDQFPYNITVSDPSHFADKFIGITIPNPELNTIEDNGYSNFCFVQVNFPETTLDYQETVIKFISNDKSWQSDYKTFWPSEFDMRVNILNDKSSISGKIIFLQYELYADYTIKRYKKFGIKDVVLNTGYSNPEITFTENDIMYNPPELYSEFNIQLSGEFNRVTSTISLVFPDMDVNSEIEIPTDYYEKLNSYIITPALPLLNYRAKLTNYASINSYSQPSRKWEFFNPGEDVSINHNKSLYLQQPVNEESNVNDNTQFIFNDIEPGGVYIYRLRPDPQIDYFYVSIITDKYPLTFKDFKTWGYKFNTGSTYYWSVMKYPGYKSVDEFVSSRLKEDTVYKKIPASERFSFTLR